MANAVPTLKGGSTLGLPSAPAIWLPTADVGSRFVLPHAAHGEVLQGFAPGWTEPAVVGGGSDHRWKLIGNAVTVDIAAWLRTRLSSHQTVGGDELASIPLDRSRPWPDAAFGTVSGQWRSTASDHPVRARPTGLAQVLTVASTTPLSARASAGFLRRVRDSGTRIDPRLLADLHDHERTMRQNDAVPSLAVR